MFKLINLFFLLFGAFAVIGIVLEQPVPDTSLNSNVQKCRGTVVYKVSARIQNGLKVPSSFTHFRTDIIAPEGPDTYTWVMQYEAQNIFGVSLAKRAVGTVSPANCDIVITAVEV